MTTITDGNYKGKITKNANGRFFVLIVYVSGNDESVVPDFEARHFATESRAIKAVEKYFAKEVAA